MGATPLENELLQYWPQLSVAQQEAIVVVMKSMIQSGEQVSVDQYNKEIDEAVTRVESGKFYTQEEVERMSEDW